MEEGGTVGDAVAVGKIVRIDIHIGSDVLSIIVILDNSGENDVDFEAEGLLSDGLEDPVATLVVVGVIFYDATNVLPVGVGDGDGVTIVGVVDLVTHGEHLTDHEVRCRDLGRLVEIMDLD